MGKIPFRCIFEKFSHLFHIEKNLKYIIINLLYPKIPSSEISKHKNLISIYKYHINLKN